MAITVTQRGNGAWGDFSAPTAKAFTLNAPITVGKRAYLAIATTVDNDSVPNPTPSANYGGICVFGNDSAGNVWNRDAYGSIAGHGGGLATTVELWSCDVQFQLNSGFTSQITPATRGLSAYYSNFEASGLATAALDKVQQSGGSITSDTTWNAAGTLEAPGTTPTLSQPNELVIAVFGLGSGAGLPASNWLTPQVVSPVWNTLFSIHGGAPGSDRGLHVLYRVVNTTAGQGAQATAGGSSTGSGLIATYKEASGVVAAVDDRLGGPAVRPMLVQARRY